MSFDLRELLSMAFRVVVRLWLFLFRGVGGDGILFEARFGRFLELDLRFATVFGVCPAPQRLCAAWMVSAAYLAKAAAASHSSTSASITFRTDRDIVAATTI